MSRRPIQLEDFPALAWREVADGIAPAVRAALEKVLERQDGVALSREECLLLASSDGADLIALLVAANELRRALVGDIVTYVVNRNINFTNVCFVGCKFCAFSRGPREADAYFRSFEEVAQKTLKARARGATEVCIQGGLPHGLPPYYYRVLLRG